MFLINLWLTSITSASIALMCLDRCVIKLISYYWRWGSFLSLSFLENKMWEKKTANEIPIAIMSTSGGSLQTSLLDFLQLMWPSKKFQNFCDHPHDININWRLKIGRAIVYVMLLILMYWLRIACWAQSTVKTESIVGQRILIAIKCIFILTFWHFVNIHVLKTRLCR